MRSRSSAPKRARASSPCFSSTHWRNRVVRDLSGECMRSSRQPPTTDLTFLISSGVYFGHSKKN